MAMHACQIGPTDTAPPCPGSPQRACVQTKGGNGRWYIISSGNEEGLVPLLEKQVGQRWKSVKIQYPRLAMPYNCRRMK